MEKVRNSYRPAAGHDWMLSFYDPLVKLLGGDDARRALLEQASIQPGQRVLDVGCGTGTLVVEIKRLQPDTEVLGLDPDPNALARAKRKAERASLSIRFNQGFSHALPYSDASIDRVLSSFVFHHIEPDRKEGTLREVRRVLRPGGVFSLLDFDGPKSLESGFLARMIHSSHHLKDNSEEQILALMARAGFAGVEKVGHDTMLFGQLRTSYYRASVPQ